MLGFEELIFNKTSIVELWAFSVISISPLTLNNFISLFPISSLLFIRETFVLFNISIAYDIIVIVSLIGYTTLDNEVIEVSVFIIIILEKFVDVCAIFG